MRIKDAQAASMVDAALSAALPRRQPRSWVWQAAAAAAVLCGGVAVAAAAVATRGLWWPAPDARMPLPQHHRRSSFVLDRVAAPAAAPVAQMPQASPAPSPTAVPPPSRERRVP